MSRKVIGCMTGTSMDGLDVCLLDIEGQGLDMKVKLLNQGSFELNNFRIPFQEISKTHSASIPDLLQLALDFGRFHATSIKSMIKNTKIDLICVHGQTLYHKPPLSLQLMNPFPIAAELKTPVVYDLRAMDLACGGEGAPITPIADQILYQISKPTVILNFGGFCNYTLINKTNKKTEITGGDICACNLILNQLSRHFFNKPYDEDGKLGLQGKLNLTLFPFVSHMLKSQSDRKKSLGTNDDDAQQIIKKSEKIPPHDVLRTVCCAIAEVIASRVSPAEEIILAGGGAFNHCITTELQYRFAGTVKTSQEMGVPAEIREAACFAILGALCQDRVSIIIPAITGGKHSCISGAWVYP